MLFVKYSLFIKHILFPRSDEDSIIMNWRTARTSKQDKHIDSTFMTKATCYFSNFKIQIQNISFMLINTV